METTKALALAGLDPVTRNGDLVPRHDPAEQQGRRGVGRAGETDAGPDQAAPGLPEAVSLGGSVPEPP